MLVVLRFIGDGGISPVKIDRVLEREIGWAQRRLRRLVKRGLAEKRPGGIYLRTPAGDAMVAVAAS